jgi:hypothetical protein
VAARIWAYGAHQQQSSTVSLHGHRRFSRTDTAGERSVIAYQRQLSFPHSVRAWKRKAPRRAWYRSTGRSTARPTRSIVTASPTIHRVTRGSRWSLGVSVGLAAVVIGANLVSLGLLVAALAKHSAHPAGLLVAAMQVWLTNVIGFGLLFWELDRGRSPGARYAAANCRPLTGDSPRTRTTTRWLRSP